MCSAISVITQKTLGCEHRANTRGRVLNAGTLCKPLYTCVKRCGMGLPGSRQTQNICITFMQCWTNVEDVGPTLYKCYTNVLCLLGSYTPLGNSNPSRHIHRPSSTIPLAQQCTNIGCTSRVCRAGATVIVAGCMQYLELCCFAKTWNKWGFGPPLCTYRLNWAMRTLWGWWDEWDETAF